MPDLTPDASPDVCPGAGWRYDADRDDPLTAHRIPVTSAHPRWAYLVVFDRESGDRPTEEETAMLASFVDHMAEWWLPGRKRANRAAEPFDISGGQNTIVLRKRGPDAWAYRRVSWTTGVYMWPPPVGFDGGQNLPLIAVLDHARSGSDPTHLNSKWEEWKAAHRDVFG